MTNNVGRGLTNLYFILVIFSNTLSSDNFYTNSYNNHGSVGLINMPTARFYNEAVHGITFYDGTPDQKITLTSNPYDWFEGSFFYTNIQGLPYPSYEFQDYKDKGFNIKLRLKKEGNLPAIAIGLNDFAGTGWYSSEYIVSSYGINNLDMHFGIGWGQYSGTKKNIKNPLGYIKDSFKTRPLEYEGKGGSLNPSQYFSGRDASLFYGASYLLNKNLLLKFEKDTIRVNGPRMPYEKRESDYSFGVDYLINDNFTIGGSFERGGFFALRFTYKNDPKPTKKYEYQTPETYESENKYGKLIRNLENNGIGVKKISETSRTLGIELTQFIHPDLNRVEQIISEATRNSGIEKKVITDIEIANLKGISNIDDTFRRNAKTIYERQTSNRIDTVTQAKFRPFLASREEFFKGILLLENDTVFILRENMFFSTNLKYGLADNFDDLRYPPNDTYPAQVRSDVKQYLKNMDKGVLIGRAQLDIHITPKENNHFMFTGGILEDMFSGIGFEYLNFKPNTNFSYGFELFTVKKRDYEWGFNHLDYENTFFTANFHYRNYGRIPFDLKISAGEYLAGDVGSTIEFSRSFSNGVRFGAFATFTDVSTEQFGEGSFDKGIFFNIPIFGNAISYTWKPLTKDPGATLVRKNNLHSLLVRLKPIN